MCFKSKVKQPKTNPDSLRAPEPVMVEETKGVDFGDEDSEFDSNIGTEALKVDREKPSTGEGTQRTQASDTGASKASNKPRGSIRRALK